ncbi:MAG TPA: hypothetical protein EYP85_15520 [Armatimonadetes bacterium]|nr:hypothetical protein [Armatimonadota bacterium]
MLRKLVSGLRLCAQWSRLRRLERRATELERRADMLEQRRKALEATLARLEWMVQEQQEELAKREAVQEELERELDRLEAQLEIIQSQAAEDERLALLEALTPLLTQLPTIRQALEEEKVSLTARDVLALFGPVEEILRKWGWEPLGEVGDMVVFDPQWHEPAGEETIEPGEPVVVKYVGSTYRGRLLCRAQVARLVNKNEPGHRH